MRTAIFAILFLVSVIVPSLIVYQVMAYKIANERKSVATTVHQWVVLGLQGDKRAQEVVVWMIEHKDDADNGTVRRVLGNLNDDYRNGHLFSAAAGDSQKANPK